MTTCMASRKSSPPGNKSPAGELLPGIEQGFGLIDMVPSPDTPFFSKTSPATPYQP